MKLDFRQYIAGFLTSSNQMLRYIFASALECIFSNFSSDCLNCYLSQDVYAKEPLPPFPASIKDGYAVLGK